MKNFISEFYKEPEIITPDDGAHYFFAYYDLAATANDDKHLCHRVSFMDRLPKENDFLEVGYLENGCFTPIAKTSAFNFQQGALLQFHPSKPETVFYNSFEGGRFATVTHNFKTGERKYTDRPCASISPDGKTGLSVNFGRIFDFRPGYGYAGAEDKNKNVNAPADDGVFLVDMETGAARLILSYAKLAPLSGFSAEEKILINHITFNKKGDRFIMLIRNFPEKGGWSTSMMLSDLHGNSKMILPTEYISHYNWLDDERILVHCTYNGQKGLHLINTETLESREFIHPFLRENDIHCNYSPDGKYIIGDSYPIDGYRTLVAINAGTGELRILLKAATMNVETDIRCDLHARFVYGGKYISFDTVHNGKREIALVSAEALSF